ncbi:uncharacterized protein LOC123470696 [Daphnia magna]|uniref:uncharacterized protein LOC123470696 n=1 Tax=Daphnia magna TaxID=35525 RepID=UPI001E1BA457|nr:uncharacterized protein LOC123470696 [Daphnia magna]
MRLQLQVYSYQLLYKPGKELYLADTLSRAPDTQEYATDQSQKNEEFVHAMLIYVILGETAKEKYAKATHSDATLQLVIGLVEVGWPNHKRDCPVPAKPFWSERASLSTAGGLLLRGHQVVVPVSLQSEILKQFHDGHFGESKCLERAKSVAYWPGYVEEIRNLVAGCRICQERRHQNPHQQYYPVEVPDHPFQRVATDFFHLRGKGYLLTVDYYSKWPCVVEMTSTTSAATIKELDKIFSDFGVPEVLVSDNGPQFGSADFRAFACHLAISHVTSSPFYPESNGQAERSIQTVKAAFVKSMEDGRTLQDTLRAIRSTPIGNGLPSPSVLLQSRNLRGSLPFLSEALRHQNVSSGAIAAALKRRQMTAAFHQKAARSSRYSILTLGQPVRVRVGKKWVRGNVKLVCQQPDSYVITTLDGRELRRNRRAINCCKGEPVVHPAKATAQKQSAVPPKSSLEQQQPSLVYTPCSRQQSVFSFPALSLPRSVISSQPPSVLQPPALQPIPSVVVLPLPPNPVRVARQVVRKPRTVKVWPSSSRSSSSLAAQRPTLLPEQRRSVSLSPARPPDPAAQVTEENLGAEPAAESTSLTPAEPSEAVQE